MEERRRYGRRMDTMFMKMWVEGKQEGQVLILYGPLIEQYAFEASEKDDTGLGRRVVMTL